MSDTVDTITIFQGTRRIVKRLLNISDGSGESAVVKFDKSAYTNGKGVEPTRLNIEWIEWNMKDIDSVRLLWDHTTDDEAVVLSGNGYKDYREMGVLKDPSSTGGTGDLLLTTEGAVSGGVYDITISVIMSD